MDLNLHSEPCRLLMTSKDIEIHRAAFHQHFLSNQGTVSVDTCKFSVCLNHSLKLAHQAVGRNLAALLTMLILVLCPYQSQTSVMALSPYQTADLAPMPLTKYIPTYFKVRSPSLLAL